MNDAEFAVQKARLVKFFHLWPDRLGLTHWNLTLEPGRGPIRDYEDAVATSEVDWRYMHATINFNCERIDVLPDDDLEEIFVHELMHVFLHELRPLEGVSPEQLAHEERVASMLATAIIRTRDAMVVEPIVPEGTYDRIEP